LLFFFTSAKIQQTAIFGRVSDTAKTSGSHVCLTTLHNPVESLFALPYRPTAALVVFSQKKYHCTPLTMLCVLPDQLRKEKMMLGTLASRVPSLVQSCSRLRCVEHFGGKREQNTTFLERISVGSLKGAGYGIVGLFSAQTLLSYRFCPPKVTVTSTRYHLPSLPYPSIPQTF